MIQDFQQTTTKDLLRPILFAVAIACRLACGCSAEPGSETAGITTQILQSSQPRRRASPAIAIQSNNYKASAAVTVDSYTTATAL